MMEETQYNMLYTNYIHVTANSFRHKDHCSQLGQKYNSVHKHCMHLLRITSPIPFLMVMEMLFG